MQRHQNRRLSQRLARIAAGPVATGAALTALMAGNGLPASASGFPVSTRVSVTDVKTNSAVVNVDFSAGYLSGSCKASAFATVRSVGATPAFHKETGRTSGGNRSASFHVDGLAPNSRFSVEATVTITGHGLEATPCRDVGQATTDAQEFTTAAEFVHSFGSDSRVLAEGATELTGYAVPPLQGHSTIFLEYGPTTAYGKTTQQVPCKPTECKTVVQFPPNTTVLTPNEIYHFRPVVQNQFSGRFASPSDHPFKAPDVCKVTPRDNSTGINYTGCDPLRVNWLRRAGDPHTRAYYNAVFNGANMTSALMSWIYMPDVQMNGTNLLKASLQHMNLPGAQMRGAILRGTNFEDSDLRGANLSGADLVLAVLDHTNLKGAILPPSIVHAQCDNFTIWPNGFADHGDKCPPPTP